MSEVVNKPPSIEDIQAELKSELDKAQEKYTRECSTYSGNPESLLYLMAPAIADSYCLIKDFDQQVQLAPIISKALAKNRILFNHRADTLSLLEARLALTEMVACELAKRLRSKSDDKEGISNETRGQLDAALPKEGTLRRITWNTY